MNNDWKRDEEIPAMLDERLRAVASKTAVLVPKSVDEAILSQARDRFAEIRQRDRFNRFWWMAAAASIALLAVIGLSVLDRGRYERADIDRSGQVDILDAFALARRIEQGSAQDFDINRDGVVNKADVDAVALQAVKLKKARV